MAQPVDQGLYLEGSELLTGEAVLLDVRPASFASRGLAFVLDATITVGLMYAVTWGMAFLAAGLDEAAAAATFVLALVALLVGLPVTVETLSRGRSAGKLALGLRVVRDDGGPIRFRQALVRGLVGVGELWLLFGSPALICSLAHPKGKRVGDLLAGTYVVRERSTPAAAPLLAMPPELAAWARSADIGRLPGPLVLSARQFLARAPRLHPASRARLGLALAADLARHVAPAPPPGTHPERLLAAVLVERRDRDLARLQREQRRRDDAAQRLHRLPYGLG